MILYYDGENTTPAVLLGIAIFRSHWTTLAPLRRQPQRGMPGERGLDSRRHRFRSSIGEVNRVGEVLSITRDLVLMLDEDRASRSGDLPNYLMVPIIRLN